MQRDIWLKMIGSRVLITEGKNVVISAQKYVKVVQCDGEKEFIFSGFYYTDTSVLLENIPLVKFTKTTSGTRVVYFP